MNAYKVYATVSENGTLVLEGLPFQSGERVEIIILEHPQTPSTVLPSNPAYPLKGTILKYEDPFEPAVPAEDWDALR